MASMHMANSEAAGEVDRDPVCCSPQDLRDPVTTASDRLLSYPEQIHIPDLDKERLMSSSRTDAPTPTEKLEK